MSAKCVFNGGGSPGDLLEPEEDLGAVMWVRSNSAGWIDTVWLSESLGVDEKRAIEYKNSQ